MKARFIMSSESLSIDYGNEFSMLSRIVSFLNECSATGIVSQNNCVSVLYPSSSILNTRKRNVSETGSVSVFR
jgi:hypothetical protein